MTTTPLPALPPQVQLLERGWLSANTVVLHGDCLTLVDSGYCTHAPQTLALIEQALQGQAPQLLINTHLHSDHCGGNAALQQRYPGLRTLIPPGQAALVSQWDPAGLSYAPTGQSCPRFVHDGVLQPGDEPLLGSLRWQVHAAPGHDPHSLILFQPEHRLLISADALWERGFGIVFPELDGVQAFDEVAATLDLIEHLAPATVIPGHGRVFTDVTPALAYARQRLERFVRNPRQHAQHAAQVLVKFKLLELQSLPLAQLRQWAGSVAIMANSHAQHFPELTFDDWFNGEVQDLVRKGAAALDGADIVNV